MSHEAQGLHVVGNGYIQRLGDSEYPVIGPLPMEYFGASPKSERKATMDPRPGREGQVLFAVPTPKEPEGKLICLSAPPALIALHQQGTERTIAVAAGTVSGERHTYQEDFGVQLAQRNIGALVVTPGVRATLETGTTGANNAITWTAVDPGPAGNDITVALVDPSGNNASLSVTVTGTDIVISLATGAGGAITSTAAQVRTAVGLNAEAAALVTTANKGTSTGAGAVVAAAKTALSGGSAAGTAYTEGTDYEVLDALEGLFRPLAGGAMGASGVCFCAYSHGTITGPAVDTGTEQAIRARVWISGYNDTDASKGRVRWEIADGLLTPGGDSNVLADAVKLEFSITPLTPAGAASPAELSWPQHGAV